MKKIKALFIDVVAQTVSEVETTNVNPAYKAILGYDSIDGVYMDGKRYCYVDSYGLLKEPMRFFRLANFSRLFAGNGLLVEIDDVGRDISTSFDVEEVRNGIIFYEVTAIKSALS